MRALEIGDEVKYAKPFLKSIGAGATDPMWFAKGKITGFVQIGKGPDPLMLARITWQNARMVDCSWCRGVGDASLVTNGEDSSICEVCDGKGETQDIPGKVNVKNLHRVGTFSASES